MHGDILLLGAFNPPKIVTGGRQKGPEMTIFGPKTYLFSVSEAFPVSISGGLNGLNIAPRMCPAMFNPFSALFNLFGAFGAVYGPIWYLTIFRR